MSQKSQSKLPFAYGLFAIDTPGLCGINPYWIIVVVLIYPLTFASGLLLFPEILFLQNTLNRVFPGIQKSGLLGFPFLERELFLHPKQSQTMQEQNIADSSELNSKPDLVIPRTSLYLLMETAKWGKFLSIVGFVFVGVILIVALWLGYFLTQIESELAQTSPFLKGPMMAGIYILMAVLYFFPCLYLYRYSQKTKAAIVERDQVQLTEALANQKSLYKFMGILTIVGLCFYAFIFLFAAAGAIFSL